MDMTGVLLRVSKQYLSLLISMFVLGLCAQAEVGQRAACRENEHFPSAETLLAAHPASSVGGS